MVIIDGFCVSACTIVLGSVPHDKICVTSRAKLGFHAAWNPGSHGRKITNPDATQTLYSMYLYEIRRWIDQRGGLSPRMIFLSAASSRPCIAHAIWIHRPLRTEAAPSLGADHTVRSFEVLHEQLILPRSPTPFPLLTGMNSTEGITFISSVPAQ
jgi:hypothetical protein